MQKNGGSVSVSIRHSFARSTVVLIRADNAFEENLLFIIRVKRELKRVYRNGCRYNERLNVETEGSKTSHIHWVTWVNIQ